MAQSAIRFVAAAANAGSKATRSGHLLHLNCHVIPGAKNRGGVVAVSEDCIELSVSARARDGAANKAAIELVVEVLRVPKSDVNIIRGLKSRDKTLTVRVWNTEKAEEAAMKLFLEIAAKQS